MTSWWESVVNGARMVVVEVMRSGQVHFEGTVHPGWL